MREQTFINDFVRITQDAWGKGWHERNGGNLSYRLTQEEVASMQNEFVHDSGRSELDISVENLANEYFLVTGSGKFFRHMSLALEENAGIIKITQDGKGYHIVWGFKNNTLPTSELFSHLLSHSIKFKQTKGKHRVIQHSHLTNIIALTFVLPLTSEDFSMELWQMATECSIVFPDGVGILPWMVPGSREIALATGELMEEYDVVIWAHHGVFGSGENLDLTFGLLDTLEKSAEILVKVLAMGGKRQTIKKEELQQLEEPFDVVLSRKVLK